MTFEPPAGAAATALVPIVPARAPIPVFEAGRPPRMRVGRRRLAPLALLAAGAVPVLLVLAPLAQTVSEAATVAPRAAFALLARPLVMGLLANTIALVVATALVAGVLGTAIAWSVERTDIPGRRAFGALAAVPLAIPPFVSSYAWVSFSPSLEGFWGALLVVSLAYMPLVTLPVAASLRGADPAIEESARALGLGPVACFVRVVLPQLRPALFGGMLLVALNTLVEFGAFTLLRFRTFTTELYAEYRTGAASSESSLLACVLVVLCLACLGLELRVRGRVAGGHARIARGAKRAPARLSLGLWRPVAFALLAAIAIASIAVPLLTVAFWLTRHDAAAFSAVGATPARVGAAGLASLRLGLEAAAVTTLLALPLGFLAARYGGEALVAVLERGAYLAQGVPGIVVALALVTLSLNLLPALYQGAALLIVAYAIVFLPLALVAVRASFVQAERAHEEAARTLGLRWPAIARRVVLPVAGNGIGAAGALVFVSVVTELTVTLLLAPIGTRTLAIEVWSDTSTLAFAAAAPYAALMAAFSLVSTWLLGQRFGQRA